MMELPLPPPPAPPPITSSADVRSQPSGMMELALPPPEPSTRNARGALQPLSLEATSQQTPRRRGGRMRSPTLDLCGNFSSAVSCGDESCEDADCTAKPGSCPSNFSSWANFLHRLVHPGCTANHSSADRMEVRSSRANLNLDSALLHLMADVMRSACILVTAVLIEVGFVADAGRADAICALLVAVFVAIGSVALLSRVCPVLGQQLVAIRQLGS